MTDIDHPPPILIAGPTASGKSALALELAERLDGTVINADSMQVYRDLRILTARPTPEDEARAPHLLYGSVPAARAYSVGSFVTDAASAIAEVRAAGRRPILVGGTGLYFKALLEGLSPIPPIGADVRERWREAAGRLGAAGLHRLLSDRDPLMAARLGATDTQRLTRALEVMDATGRSLAEWQREPGTPLLDAARTPRLLVCPDRTTLHARADARFERMIAEGALDEVRHLHVLGIDENLPVMRAIGVRPLSAVLAGTRDIASAVEDAKAETRQYIKRQQTWSNRHMMSWKPLYAQQIESISSSVLPFIQSFD